MILIGSIMVYFGKESVHFEDGEKGLKCSVPIGRFRAGWHQIRSNPTSEFHWIDRTNGTQLSLTVFASAAYQPGLVGCKIEIERVEFSELYTKLDRACS